MPKVIEAKLAFCYTYNRNDFGSKLLPVLPDF